MSKRKSKDKKKAAQLVIRLEKQDKEQFLAVCERLDTSAARELRRFMRGFVAANAVVAAEAATDEAADEPAPEVTPPAAVAAPVDVEAPLPERAESEAPAAPAARKRRLKKA